MFWKVLPKEGVIERIQQVGQCFRKPLSPSFGAIRLQLAGIFCNLRYVFATGDRRRQVALQWSLVGPRFLLAAFSTSFRLVMKEACDVTSVINARK